MPGWTLSDIPDQSGRRAIVTGGATGIGFETAKALAVAGASVVIASRDIARGNEAVAAIRAASNGAAVSFAPLDLASLASVRDFADNLSADGRSIDLLVNNAGVMMLPRRDMTPDGFERQFATNHLGPFVLTALLWPLLKAGRGARVVTVASLAHWRGRMDFENFDGSRGYGPYAAYAQTKLANLLFAFELARRTPAEGPVSAAAHPGIAATPLVRSGLGSGPGVSSRLLIAWYDLVGQSAASGALPILRAAAAPDVRPGQYYGPRGLLGFRGPPAVVRASSAARSREAARRLWELSEQLTGIRFAPGA